MKLIVSGTKEEAADLASKLLKKMVTNKPITVLFPGGSTPKIFFNKLINFDLDWEKISLLASDERVVSLSSNNSNTGMIERELLDHIITKVKPKLVRLYPLKKDNIEDTLETLDEYLSHNIPKIAFLGIGKDGHTAGIFKDKETKDNCYLLKNRMEPYPRITISMNMLIKIPNIVFFVLGSRKKESLENIIFKNNNEKFLPAKFLLKNGLGKKTILCDKKAAPYDFDVGESIISI